LGIDTRGSIVRSDEDHLVVTLGVEDIIVVHTPGATLVAKKQDEERIREVVKEIEARGWNDVL
jgi:mannose-1-phosphate guanylyltransferase